MQQLKSFISKYLNISDLEYVEFVNITQLVKFKKNEMILSEGEHCNFLLFILSGCIRYFYVVDGQENTAQFFFENDFFTDYESFITGKPSKINIQALENCEMLKISKSDLYKLYDEIPRFERLGRLLAENAYIGLRNRRNEFLNKEPHERYIHLMQNRPEVIQRVPQHIIASFIGIKPQSLSRIRKKISLKMIN